MKKLEYTVNCLDGVYCFVAEFEDNVLFSVDSTIESISQKNGELDAEKSRIFIDEINKAEIERWDKEYYGQEIEDGIRWTIRYFVEDKEYVSKGFESYQPYNYEHLIKAILMCDKESEYLFNYEQ